MKPSVPSPIYVYKAPNLWPHLCALRSRVISSRSQHKLCELWQSPGDRAISLSPSLSLFSLPLFHPLFPSFYLSLLPRGYVPQSSCGFVLNWTSKSLWDRSKKTGVCNLYFCLSTMSGRRVAFSDITASSILSRGGRMRDNQLNMTLHVVENVIDFVRLAVG